MTRPFRRRGTVLARDAHFGPNMTPMVDVVMVILIFFMASAAFVGPELFLRAGLPARGAGPAPADDPFALPAPTFAVRLARTADGLTVASGLGPGPEDLASFEKRAADLARASTGVEIAVILTPDPNVPYADVIAAHDACSRAGIARVGLMNP